MQTPDPVWESALSELWASLDRLDEDDFVARMKALTAQLPSGHAVASFEEACAWDSTGHSDKAVPLYQAALASGLDGQRRRRAVIQMASSLRNMGRADLAAQHLQLELKQPHDELSEAVKAFLALALADLGREREALAICLESLSTYLPRYNRSLARYARSLVDPAT